jgi:hypothetical protein
MYTFFNYIKIPAAARTSLKVLLIMQLIDVMFGKNNNPDSIDARTMSQIR